MARLLATQRQTAVEHFLHHVLVADRAAHEIDSERLQRELETDVAHHGGDDGVAFQASFALQLSAAHQQHRVAVDDLTAMVDEDRAIAVAVERDAHLAAALRHRAREPLRMRRSAAEIDVAAVRFVADDDRLDAEAREQPRRHRRRRAVRAVDRQHEPFQAR